jgi:hypothetical protein
MHDCYLNTPGTIPEARRIWWKDKEQTHTPPSPTVVCGNSFSQVMSKLAYTNTTLCKFSSDKVKLEMPGM